MKKIALTGMILSIVLVGCGNNQIQVPPTTVENSSIPVLTQEEVTTIEENTQSESDTLKANILVTASDKISYDVDLSVDRYQEFVEIVTTVQNNTDKDIKGIQGIYHIKDMFGEKIIDANFDITSEVIPVGQTITIKDYGFNINDLIIEQKKLFDTAFDSLIFEYEITQVIFTDGTSL